MHFSLALKYNKLPFGEVHASINLSSLNKIEVMQNWDLEVSIRIVLHLINFYYSFYG